MPDMVVREGETLTLPVPLGHALARHQSYRDISDDEIRRQPLFDAALQALLAERGAEEEERAVLDHGAILQWRRGIGPILVFGGLNDLVIESGATLLINQTATELFYDNVTIGGTLKVVSPNPHLPVILKLFCASLGGPR